LSTHFVGTDANRLIGSAVPRAMTPELLTPAWLSALATIILIDLVLAGDNAIVIGLAARDVPRERQRLVVLWGTAGAIAVRVLLTGVVVWLLRVPAFLLIGGLALIYIGWKLTQGANAGEHAIKPRHSVRGAIGTIIVADAVMGIDNVLAIGGAAQGSMLLVVIGLAVSVPIVIWGSTLVLKWVERYPAILWLGAGVLGWTAAKMIASEPLLKARLGEYPVVRTALYLIVIGGLIAMPLWRSLSPPQRAQGAVIALLALWLTFWGWVESAMGIAFDLVDRWKWDDEIVDLVRWVGWIPFALWVDKKFRTRRHVAAGLET
jgi:YjbE family integral membrane protein